MGLPPTRPPTPTAVGRWSDIHRRPRATDVAERGHGIEWLIGVIVRASLIVREPRGVLDGISRVRPVNPRSHTSNGARDWQKPP
jgi:hypothetical protein